MENLYNEILEIIKRNFAYSVTYLEMENDIQICDERSFEGWFQNGLLEPNTIYIIVSFEEGTIWFGNQVLPVTFVVYSELGSFDKARTLLTYVANTYNFQRDTSNTASVIQSYSIPQMQEEFAEENNSYRAIFNMSGTFVYGENISGIAKLELYNETTQEYDTINFIDITCKFTMSPSSANIGNNKNRIHTLNKSGAFTMAFSIPSIASSNLVSIVDSIMYGEQDINTTFTFQITKNDNATPFTKVLHIIDIEYTQEIADMPMLALGFGE